MPHTLTHTASWFVRTLYGASPPAGHLVLFRSRQEPIYWTDLQDLSNLDGNVETLSKRSSVYLSVCAQDKAAALKEKQHRLDQSEKTRGQKADLKYMRGFIETVKVVPALWFEIDFRDDAAHAKSDLPTEADAVAFIDELPLAPSLVIASGHGFHLYWILRSPFVIGKETERSAVQRLVQRWQDMLRGMGAERGWNWDSTHDLTRVLRPPGTLNHKSDPPKPVTVIRESDARYGFTEFEQLMPGVRTNDQAGVMPPDGWSADEVREMLQAINTRPAYNDWFRISAAVLDAVKGDLDTAVRLLKEWRPEEVEGEYEAKLTSGLNGSISVGTLWYFARRHGYKTAAERRIYKGSGKITIGGDGAATEPETPGDEEPALPPLFRHTDLGNGYLMAYTHGQDLRYCYDWKHWLHWDGRRWKRDDSGEVVRRAKETVERLHEIALTVQDDEERTRLRKWALSSESANRITNMIRLAESDLPVQPDQLDGNPDVLCVLNGTIDLRTGELLEHRRGDLITKLAPVRYDEHATCPRWQQFVEEVFDGDAELVAYMQRLAGYSMTGSVREQALPILYGAGSNGKSTLIETIQDILGDYAQTARSDLLMLKRQTGGTSEDEAALKGARFVAASESQGNQRISEAVVKRLTGGDTIRARLLYSNEFEFQPTHKIWLATNHRPVIGDTDHAIWRRIHLIPFEVSFKGTRQDKNLARKLQAERSGILMWMLEGCLAWRHKGLSPPEAVQAATQQYRAEMDVLAAFLQDRCETGIEQMQVQATRLYRAYADWCDQTGERPEKQRSFGARLTERGFERTRKTDGFWYLGIGLKSEQPQSQNEAPF